MARKLTGSNLAYLNFILSKLLSSPGKMKTGLQCSGFGKHELETHSVLRAGCHIVGKSSRMGNQM